VGLSKPPQKILIATTRRDISLDYFLDTRVSCVYFDDDFAGFEATLSENQFDVVYIRDPFNNPDDSYADLKERLDLIVSSQPKAYYVDQANDIDKIYLEDKWNQYLVMKQFMPKTVIAQPDYFIEGKHIAKKRISSRSRDIIFLATDVPIQENWIIQEMVPLEEELRVYAVNGTILREASIKMSKTAEKKTKVIGTRQLSEAEYNFVETILKGLPELDLVGLDIAVSKDQLSLIEVNRAPQFKRYNKIIGKNIVADFFNQLVMRQA
jgi:glutathione synthase/RimK-type ligase-like ATP-grasp enzyme